MTLLQPSSHTYCTCHTIILLDGDVALLFFTFQEHLLVEDIIFFVQLKQKKEVTVLLDIDFILVAADSFTISTLHHTSFITFF